MTAIDLEHDPSSLCGPVDARVARRVEAITGHTLDPSYLRHLERWHGGVPRRQVFLAQDGRTYRLGRFLTLLDAKSPLAPPLRPSTYTPGRDARVDWSVLTLLDEEGPVCRGLFGGERLVPFAALYGGPHHPDHMQLSDGYVDLLAFSYEPEVARPRVVVWRAAAAGRVRALGGRAPGVAVGRGGARSVRGLYGSGRSGLRRVPAAVARRGVRWPGQRQRPGAAAAQSPSSVSGYPVRV